MHVKAVAASRGWKWIVEGFLLFRRSPLNLVGMVFILYAGMRLVAALPMPIGLAASLFAMLLMPAFLAGLMHACQELDQGRRIHLAYLFSGFRQGTSRLITLGGIGLAGNLLTLMVLGMLGGDAFQTLAKMVADTAKVTPDQMEAVREAVTKGARAIVIGLLVSLPVMMALWFAPLLVFFRDNTPAEAMRQSLQACARNLLPFLVYGVLIFVALIALFPVSRMLRQVDFALWALGPVLIPTVYASYKDLFAPATADAVTPD